jgi:hypothetical protein
MNHHDPGGENTRKRKKEQQKERRYRFTLHDFSPFSL